MRRIHLSLLACFIFASSALACEDDTRLSSLPELMQDIRGINPPLEMTSETWLRLDPEAADLVKESVHICDRDPAAKQMVVDFSLILEQVMLCYRANSGDARNPLEKKDKIRRIRECVFPFKVRYKAREIEAGAFYSLMTQPIGSPAERDILANALHARVYNTNYGKFFFTAEIFRSFGGKVINPGKFIVYGGVSIETKYDSEIRSKIPYIQSVTLSKNSADKFIKVFENCLSSFGFKVYKIESVYVETDTLIDELLNS